MIMSKFSRFLSVVLTVGLLGIPHLLQEGGQLDKFEEYDILVDNSYR